MTNDHDTDHCPPHRRGRLLPPFVYGIVAAIVLAGCGNGTNPSNTSTTGASGGADTGAWVGEPGALKAIGVLQIAGVEREVTLPLKTTRKGDALAVSGEIDVLMTDYGIAPPKAMMGMVKADPKVTVTFDVQLGAASTN